jgi:hypothetical protein
VIQSIKFQISQSVPLVTALDTIEVLSPTASFALDTREVLSPTASFALDAREVLSPTACFTQNIKEVLSPTSYFALDTREVLSPTACFALDTTEVLSPTFCFALDTTAAATGVWLPSLALMVSSGHCKRSAPLDQLLEMKEHVLPRPQRTHRNESRNCDFLCRIKRYIANASKNE